MKLHPSKRNIWLYHRLKDSTYRFSFLLPSYTHTILIFPLSISPSKLHHSVGSITNSTASIKIHSHQKQHPVPGTLCSIHDSHVRAHCHYPNHASKQKRQAISLPTQECRESSLKVTTLKFLYSAYYVQEGSTTTLPTSI